ncbi:Endoglucanase [Gryllus bimaculatus]|nr:Endoglucanase [Gryllus bimaculatus]
MARPAFSISPSKPGSDLAGESAAAFAAASIALRDYDAGLANELVERARELFALANDYRGKYSDSITDAANFYAAAWLARATGEQWVLDLAENFYSWYGIQWNNGFGWDAKGSGADAVLAGITGKQVYTDNLRSYCDHLLYSQQRTPKGLAARLNINSNTYWNFVKEQIDYMLGDSGRSYVCGFGNNPPLRPHHRGSSCPSDVCTANTCNWNTFGDSGPNPNVLYGALVGGPDEWDNYVDRRDDAVQNEVALDYNAAFQGVVAALAARYA